MLPFFNGVSFNIYSLHANAVLINKSKDVKFPIICITMTKKIIRDLFV